MQTSQQTDAAGRPRTDAPEAPTESEKQVRLHIKQLEGVSDESKHFEVSPLRWRILLGICTFGFCNGISNESNSILNVYTGALGLSISDYVYLTQVFFFVPWLGALSSAVLVERGGVKLAVYSALFFSSLRNSARALLFTPAAPGWHHLRWLYWSTQEVFKALTISQYYVLPLRVAESWFADSERSLALNLMLALPTLGGACAALLFPHFMPDYQHAGLLADANLIMAATSILFVAASVRRSSPREGAPSARNQKNLDQLGRQAREPLLGQLKRVLAHRQYLLHVFALSAADPLLWTVQVISQDIFRAAGMNSLFCGQYLALSNIVGVCVQILCSYLWRAKSKRHAREALERASRRLEPAEARDPLRTLKCKWLLCVQMSLFVAFCYTLIIHELHAQRWLLESQWWLVLATTVCFVSVRAWAAPYYNEQAAELICGRISEPTAGACSMATVTLMINVSNLIFVRLRQQAGHSSSGPPRAVYKWSVLFEMLAAVSIALLYTLAFQPDKRPQEEASRGQLGSQ